MRWFRNFRIKPKLFLSFTVVIVFSVVMTVLAVTAVNRIDSSYTYLLNFPQKRFEYLMEVQSNCLAIRQASTAIVLNAADSEKVNSYWSQFGQAYDNAIGYIDKYLENNNSDTVRDQATLSANSEIMSGVKKQLESYRTISERGKETALATNDIAETNPVFLDGVTIISEVSTTIENLLPKAAAYTAEVSEANTQEKDSDILLFVIVLFVIIVFSLVITFYVSGLISKPIILLTTFMKKAGTTGDITLRPEDVENIGKMSQVKDEVGECIASTANFVNHLAAITDELKTIAEGNLTTEIDVLSESDVMGVAMQNMVDNLNTMFGEINVSTAQVAIGSKQIADGAQSLAQGATEQASAIEELSASINEISEKTKHNAGIAREAADLSGTIIGSVEKGSVLMDQMMQAVGEISEASNQIGKVIKVIDDIAFQTNILALNAAVEAARAGQHGKGFAVVAEEVRNLASKSANAAKDTGGLIEDSIEKANFGFNIATETSVSLKEIVEGINHSAEIVAQIAQSSDEQASAIAQINTGIEQVAQVVQQNSATAEESAAASEEMSGQSNMLEQLIAQFKLKNSELPHSFNELSHKKAMPRESDFHLSERSGEYGKY